MSVTPSFDTRGVRDRLDRWVATAFLVALAFVQKPGLTAADTKLDLVVNPGGFLSRALNLWDPLGAAGQLQNQAYGYLFPMGPFFWVGHAVGLPAWIIQRLWWALILVVAWRGLHRVLEELGIGDRVSRLLAAFAYALAPRMFMGLGAISSEIWPMAVAPWILLPLLRAQPGGERPAAFRSGAAILLLGAVNAVASLATLILPAWWILTRVGRLRQRMLAWWAVAVALATAWWLGPLLLLGRYSPPFLDWIESARATTALASPTEALRGTTQWLAAVSGGSDPVWPAGWVTLSSRTAVAAGLIIVVTGLVGLAASCGRWKTFARGGLLIGLVLVTFGHNGGVAPPWSGAEADLLDGVLAPFRNNHKFEPVVRLPMALGVAHGIPLAIGVLRRGKSPLIRRGRAWWATLVPAFVALALGVQILPAALTGVVQRGPFVDVPSSWTQAASWLDEHADGGRTLVLPGGNSPARIWGEPKDEPFQAVAKRPWVVRDGVPLGSAGATRILTEIESRVAQGQGGDPLLNLMGALGVTRVLIAGDHRPLTSSSTPPLVVRAAVMSTGARSVASFGAATPPVEGSEVAVNWGLERPVADIELLAVPTQTSVAPTQRVPLSQVGRYVGGPEGVARLDVGPAVQSEDPSAAVAGSGNLFSTDTLQRRTSSFSSATDVPGPLMRADEPYPEGRAVHDYWPAPITEDRADVSDLQTVRVDHGAVHASSSSTLARPAFGQTRALDTEAWRAFDTSGDTGWQSAGYVPDGQWIKLSWVAPTTLPQHLIATFDMASASDVAAVSVVTEAGRSRTPISSPRLVSGANPRAYPVSLTVPQGKTRWIQLVVDAVRAPGGTVRVLDFGAVGLPRVAPTVRMPTVGGDATVLSLEATGDSRPACYPLPSGVLACSPDRMRHGEEEAGLRREFSRRTPASFEASGTAIARGSGADSLLKRLDGVTAQASSRWLDVPGLSPDLVVDGDPKTYWASRPSDGSPTLDLSWQEPRLVTGLVFTTDPDVAGRRPTQVEVTLDGDTYQRTLTPEGSLDLPPVRSRSVRISITGTTASVSQTPRGRAPMPIVVGDVALKGEPWTAGLPPSSTVQVSCGFGPVVQVAGTTYETRVTTTRQSLIAGEEATLRVCSPIRAPQGKTALQALASVEFSVRSLTLDARPNTVVPSDARQTSVTTDFWGATKRRVDLGEAADRDTLIVVRENANPGWTATVGSTRLTPVVIDGWAQGWVVPAGQGGKVLMEFGPQRTFSLALMLGAVAALCLLAFALGSHPRPRRAAPQLAESRMNGWIGPLAVAGGLVVLGGAWGLVSALVALGLGATGRIRTQAIAGFGACWLLWSAWSPWPSHLATNRGLVSGVLALLLVGIALTWGQRWSRPTVGPSLDGRLDESPAEGRDDR